MNGPSLPHQLQWGWAHPSKAGFGKRTVSVLVQFRWATQAYSPSVGQCQQFLKGHGTRVGASASFRILNEDSCLGAPAEIRAGSIGGICWDSAMKAVKGKSASSGNTRI